MHHTALLGGAWTIDALEPAAHKLVEFEVFGRRRQQRVGDIISECLQLLWRQHIRKRRPVGDATRYRADQADHIDLPLKSPLLSLFTNVRREI